MATIAPSFADFLLGYQRLSELSVQLAVTEFRAISQNYYITDTWRMRDNMTLDLGLRYEYAAVRGQSRHADQRPHAVLRPGAARGRHVAASNAWCASAKGSSTRILNIRFNPTIQTARDGRLGNRLVDDDKLNFAPRAGWAWTPTPKTSIRAGVGMFYMQDTGNPRFDMARNAAGRRQDNSNQFFGPQLERALRGLGDRMPAACSRRSSASRTTTCSATTTDRTTPRMCNTSSTCSARSGRNRRSRSATSARAATTSSACSIATMCFPGTSPVQCKRPYPEFTRVQTIGNVAEASYNSLSAKLTRRLNNGFSALVGYTLSKSEDNGSGIRTLNGDHAVPAEQQLRGG